MVLRVEIPWEAISISSEKSTASLKQIPDIFHVSALRLACTDEETEEHETYGTCHSVAAINFSFTP